LGVLWLDTALVFGPEGRPDSGFPIPASVAVGRVPWPLTVAVAVDRDRDRGRDRGRGRGRGLCLL